MHASTVKMSQKLREPKSEEFMSMTKFLGVLLQFCCSFVVGYADDCVFYSN